MNNPLMGTAIALFAAVIPLQALDNGTSVTSLYYAVLNRAPDPVGWMYYKGVIDQQQASQDQVTGFFLASPEYTNTGCATNNTSFLDCLYWDAFGRTPDSGGLNFWMGQLNPGETRNYVVEQFITSPEFQRFQGSGLGYRTAYVAETGIDPSTAGGPPGTVQTFTVHYTNPYGPSDISNGEVLFNSDPNAEDGNGSCQVLWDTGNNITLASTSGSLDGSFGGPGPLSNQYCSIDTARSTLVAIAGVGYDVSLRMTFTQQFDMAFSNLNHQIMSIGLNAEGLASGRWVGSWTSTPPTYVLSGSSLVPGYGQGTGGTFTFTIQDPTSVNNIDFVQLSFEAGTGSCMVQYSTTSTPAFSILLDPGSGSMSSPAALGSVLTSPYCSATPLSVSASGATLTIALSISFDPSFSGNLGSFLFAQSKTGAKTKQPRGTYTSSGSSPGVCQTLVDKP